MNTSFIKSLALVINLKSFVVAALAVLSTYISLRFNIIADYPLTLISTAIVFPIVFSIGHAYKRREVSLDQYGNIKAHGRALYFSARDWLPERSEERMSELVSNMEHLLSSARSLFKSDRTELEKHEKEVYKSFSQLSLFVKHLRTDGLSNGECSRLNQFISKMMVSFEKVKHIYQYRTPRTLRAFSEFFIILLPILYGPYFAAQALEYNSLLIYVMPVLFAFILTGLENIQDHLEDPFDQIGEDDVMINAEKFSTLLRDMD